MSVPEGAEPSFWRLRRVDVPNFLAFPALILLNLCTLREWHRGCAAPPPHLQNIPMKQIRNRHPVRAAKRLNYHLHRRKRLYWGFLTATFFAIACGTGAAALAVLLLLEGITVPDTETLSPQRSASETPPLRSGENVEFRVIAALPE